MSLTARLFILAALCALLQGSLATPNYSMARRSLPTGLAGMTNAERLARGLPLKKPQFKRHGDKQKPSAVPTSNAPASTQVAAAATCNPQSGVVKVTSADGSVDGFLAPPADDEALYGFTANQTAAATVKLDTCNGTPFNIVGKACEFNGETFENLGGAEDPQTGCVFVSNVAQLSKPEARSNPLATKQGAASSQCGSAIWALDGTALAPQWPQTNETATPLVYVKDRNGFALESDTCTGVKANFTFVSA